VGTLFPASGDRLESRKRWLLSGTSVKGDLVVDDGAADALVRNHRSLLPAGLVEVRGTFERGDMVSVADRSQRRVAVGIANYGSEALNAIKGLRSERIGEVLGYDYGDEAVHRNSMAVL
jgi:glutamate 5-kinase